ncbi:Hypothetical predicted protein [Scomber scombrus]|uniref:Uncharacterized protein n=1 Tax=Scomber scombrus TaxID=13677 RepID=A0AAV1NVM6_SCOSC
MSRKEELMTGAHIVTGSADSSDNCFRRVEWKSRAETHSDGLKDRWDTARQPKVLKDELLADYNSASPCAMKKVGSHFTSACPAFVQFVPV